MSGEPLHLKDLVKLTFHKNSKVTAAQNCRIDITPCCYGVTVYGVGCRVKSVGCRVRGEGCRVHSVGCTVYSLGCTRSGVAALSEEGTTSMVFNTIT